MSLTFVFCGVLFFSLTLTTLDSEVVTLWVPSSRLLRLSLCLARFLRISGACELLLTMRGRPRHLRCPLDLLRKCNMWNHLLATVAESLVPDAEWGRVVLTCHFAIDLLCEEMHALSERGPPLLSPVRSLSFFREPSNNPDLRSGWCRRGEILVMRSPIPRNMVVPTNNTTFAYRSCQPLMNKENHSTGKIIPEFPCGCGTEHLGA